MNTTTTMRIGGDDIIGAFSELGLTYDEDAARQRTYRIVTRLSAQADLSEVESRIWESVCCGLSDAQIDRDLRARESDRAIVIEAAVDKLKADRAALGKYVTGFRGREALLWFALDL